MGDGVAERRERFESIYRELYPAICGYVLRRVREPEDAAEIVAETFATLWRRLRRLPQGRRATALALRRRALASSRTSAAANRRRSALSDRLVENFDRDVFETVGPAEDSSALARAFSALSESDRELLSLVAWEGLTREELAVALGTSRAVVRLRLHRAGKRLRAALPPAQVRFTGGQEHEWT